MTMSSMKLRKDNSSNSAAYIIPLFWVGYIAKLNYGNSLRYYGVPIAFISRQSRDNVHIFILLILDKKKKMNIVRFKSIVSWFNSVFIMFIAHLSAI